MGLPRLDHDMLIDGDVRTTAAGFLGAIAVLAVLFLVVGVNRILDALASADVRVVAAMVVVALLWLFCWSIALRTVLGVLGVDVTYRHAFIVFAAAMFANNITPFGQAGGEPVTAMFISNSSDAEYETALAAIASVDALNFVPSIGFALLGLGYYAATLTLGRRLRLAAGAVAALAIGVPILAYVGWQYRRRIERTVVRIVHPLVHAFGRIVPRRNPPSTDQIRARVRDFFRSIDRVATDRRQLAIALSFSALGWLCIMTSLWLALYALGHPVFVAVVLIAIPVGSMAGITPLPGGLGGVEAVLILLLVPIPGLTRGVATAAVIIHRATTYWLPLLLGASAASALSVNRR